MTEHPNLNAALAAAQAQFPTIAKNKTATIQTKAGGSYSYSYADLADILEAIRPVLAEHGLAIMQRFVHHGGGITLLRTELRHSAEGVVGGELVIDTSGEPRDLGTRITYYRRYCIVALLGLATDDDIDAPPQVIDYLSEQQRKKIHALKGKLINAGRLTHEAFDDQLQKDFGSSVSGLCRADASILIDRLTAAERKLDIELAKGVGDASA